MPPKARTARARARRPVYSMSLRCLRSLNGARARGRSWLLHCGLLSDPHETGLEKLSRPRHRISVHLDAWKQVGIPPVVGTCGRAAELNLNVASLEVSEKIFVGIARRNVAVGVVGGVVQCQATGVCMKHRCDLGLCVPVPDLILDELKVEDRRRKIAFKLQ